MHKELKQQFANICSIVYQQCSSLPILFILPLICLSVPVTSGVVTDFCGNPISNANITTGNHSQITHTDKDGVFFIPGIESKNTRNKTTSSNWYMVLSASSLELFLSTPSDIDIKFFNLQGQCIERFFKKSVSGSSRHFLPKIKKHFHSLLIMLVRIGKTTKSFHVINLEENRILLNNLGILSPLNLSKYNISSNVYEQLLIEHPDFQSKTISLVSLSDSQLITLEPARNSANDPYTPELGNTGYDVEHYFLHFSIDPLDKDIYSRARILAKCITASLSAITLDFWGFDIQDLSVNGINTRYCRIGKKLLVHLPEAVDSSDTFSLEIYYSGRCPQTGSPYFTQASHLGLFFFADTSLYVDAYPDGSQNWFPCNNHPRDKATYKVEMVVPPGYTGVSGGKLIDVINDIADSSRNGRASDVYVWESKQPVTSVLLSFGVGKYLREEKMSPGGIAIRNYVNPQYANVIPLDTIGKALDWMVSLFGEYPFEEFGYYTYSANNGCLATQSIVTTSEFMIHSYSTLIHEMAHMWFVNWVAPDSWADNWRNEGFATYTQMMWSARGDTALLDQQMNSLAKNYGPLNLPFPLNNPPKNQMFSSYIYYSGAVLAHELRKLMGDQAFFAGLKSYFDRYGGSTASHQQFQAELEYASGKNLNEFFKQWFILH